MFCPRLGVFCFSVRPWLSAQLETELSDARAEIAALGAACDAATAALEREREAVSDAADEAARAARADADARAESLQARVRERRAVDAAAVTSCRGRDHRVSYRPYCHRRDLT